MLVLSETLIFPPCFLSGLSLWVFGFSCEELKTRVVLWSTWRSQVQSLQTEALHRTKHKNFVRIFVAVLCFRCFLFHRVKLISSYSLLRGRFCHPYISIGSGLSLSPHSAVCVIVFCPGNTLGRLLLHKLSKRFPCCSELAASELADKIHEMYWAVFINPTEWYQWCWLSKGQSKLQMVTFLWLWCLNFNF